MRLLNILYIILIITLFTFRVEAVTSWEAEIYKLEDELQNRPENPGTILKLTLAYNNLANHYVSLNDYFKAFIAYEQALAYSPNQQKIIENLSEAYFLQSQDFLKQGQIQQAEKAAKRALEIHPDNINAKNFLNSSNLGQPPTPTPTSKLKELPEATDDMQINVTEEGNPLQILDNVDTESLDITANTAPDVAPEANINEEDSLKTLSNDNFNITNNSKRVQNKYNLLNMLDNVKNEVENLMGYQKSDITTVYLEDEFEYVSQDKIHIIVNTNNKNELIHNMRFLYGLYLLNHNYSNKLPTWFKVAASLKNANKLADNSLHKNYLDNLSRQDLKALQKEIRPGFKLEILTQDIMSKKIAITFFAYLENKFPGFDQKILEKIDKQSFESAFKSITNFEFSIIEQNFLQEKLLNN